MRAIRSRPAFSSDLAATAALLVLYVACIAGANWMIDHVGREVAGRHMLPVGFGLLAPSGVYLAGFTFVLRDLVQRTAGLRVGAGAVLVGAVISALVSDPRLALASGVTFLVSESCDLAIYTPLQSRNFPAAVAGSGLVAEVVDSVVFLTLAGIPLGVALPGQLLGKAWAVAAGGMVAALLRRTGPFSNPALVAG